MMHPVEYVINTAHRKAHIYRVAASVSKPPSSLTISLPCWIPGSYMVRDFARFISGLQAHQGATACEVIAQDLSTWQIIPQGSGELVIRYEVYAFDTSVRAAFLDEHRGFFNATSLCVRVHGHEHLPHTLTLEGLAPDWAVATAMPHVSEPSGQAVGLNSAKTYGACNYDELVDHPFELGHFWQGTFEAGGALHECVITGAWPSSDYARLLQDMQRICAAHIAFWHGPEGRAPFERYVFMLHLTEDGYGGLEHRASTALIAARKDLPRHGDHRMTDGYITLLGLISHEYFHAWNVKRLVPAELLTLDYQRANHTPLLWFFEGFTSYYDDLMLLRAGVIDETRYLKLLSKNWMGMLNMPGRYAQSVAQASFDAWGKYYRVDENTPNITVSYYSKGAMVALCLDLSLRRDGVGSLDDVMRGLWQTCAKAAAPENHDGRWPVTEALIAEHIHKIAPHRDAAAGWKAWVHGVEDLPITDLLNTMGIQTRVETQGFAQQWGLRLSEGPVTGCVIRSVLRHSGAEQTGLCAGDEIIALNGWRVRKLDDAAQALEPNAAVSFCIARGQRIFHLNATLPPSSTPMISHIDCSITALAADSSEAAQQAQTRRAQWLYSHAKAHA